MRAGIRATVAAAVVTASWVTLAASAEVVYPAAQAETSRPRLAVHVAPVSLAAAKVESAPALTVSATVAQSYTVSARADAHYAALAARVEVLVDGADASAAFVELEVESDAGFDLSISPALASVDAIPAAAILSSVDFSAPFVSLVESSLIWQLEFFDVVLVTDDITHVRSVAPLDTVVVNDALNKFDIEKVISDSVVVLDVATPFQVSEGSIADAVATGDLIEFELVYSLELHDGITSTLNASLLNQWIFNGNDTGETLFASDNISLEPGKVFADSVSSSDAIAFLHVQKALADSTVALDAIAYSIAKELADSVAVIDVMSIEYNASREIHDGITSTINGAPLNQWALNYSDTGDWLMPSDWLAVQMGKPLTDSITAGDLISVLLIEPTVLNGTTLNELTLN